MKFVLVLVWFFLLSVWSFAQFDDLDLPPPPGPRFNEADDGNVVNLNRDQSMLNNSSGSEGGPQESETSKILSKEKKEKLSQASIDEITDKAYPDLIDSFEFNNAEITDVIRAIGELTGKNFIVDPNVKGKITIMAPSKITVAEAYKAFLSALAINHYSIVAGDGFYKIKSSKVALKDNIETYTGDYYPNSDQMITRIVQVKHISAEQIQRDLKPLTTSDGDIQAIASTNSLIISDYGSTIDKIMKILAEMDVPGFEEKLEVVKVSNARARDLAEMINKIISNDSGSAPRSGPPGGMSYSSGTSRFGGGSFRGGTSSNGAVFSLVVPDERTNSLIVLGNKQGLTRVKKIVNQLDFKIDGESSGGVHVYYVKYGDAETMAQTLSGLAKDNRNSIPPFGGGIAGGRFGAQPPTSTSVFGNDVKVVADKDTNSLIITASKSDYGVVLDLLSKIDIPRDQVYVEAVILEMLLDDDFKWGLGYFSFDKKSKGLGRQGFVPDPDILGLGLNPLGGKGAILSFGSGDFFEVPSPQGGPLKISSLLGLLNFLKGTGRTNVLSTPQIMALDNEESQIEVGQEVAVGMDTTTINAVTQQTPKYKKATIKLKIKPFISPTSESIRLKIDQDVAQPEQQAALPNTVTLSTRSVATNIVVPNGDTAVLGGLVKDQEQESVSKIPLLGDIPILGWLFKARKISKQKTNLFIFITPRIIRTEGDSHKLVDEKLGERLEFIKQTGGRDPYGKVLDRLPRRKPKDENSQDQNQKSSGDRRRPNALPTEKHIEESVIPEAPVLPPIDSSQPQAEPPSKDSPQPTSSTVPKHVTQRKGL